MVTFLRKIRKSLIESGAARKYLLYAIGEITLVVIGILIALQINNWNEWRKDRIIENQALHDLLNEFKTNHVIFEEYIRNKQQSNDEWLVFLNLINDPEVPDSQKGRRRPAFGREVYTPSMGMLNSIMVSDKIDKLENDSLRYWLSNWADLILQFHKEEEMQIQFLTDIIMPYEASLIPFSFKGQEFIRDSLELQHYYIKAYNDLKYQNLLARNRHNILGILSRGAPAVNNAFNHILRILEVEVNRSS